MKSPHMARILELLQHYLKTFLNFENSLSFQNLVIQGMGGRRSVAEDELE